jgi:hypothetical protein
VKAISGHHGARTGYPSCRRLAGQDSASAPSHPKPAHNSVELNGQYDCIKSLFAEKEEPKALLKQG